MEHESHVKRRNRWWKGPCFATEIRESLPNLYIYIYLFIYFYIYIHMPGFAWSNAAFFPLEQSSGEYDHFGVSCKTLGSTTVMNVWQKSSNSRWECFRECSHLHDVSLMKNQAFFHMFFSCHSTKTCLLILLCSFIFGKTCFLVFFLDQSGVVCWIIMLDSHSHLLVVKFYGMEIEIESFPSW